jgi:hypothetical protein
MARMTASGLFVAALAAALGLVQGTAVAAEKPRILVFPFQSVFESVPPAALQSIEQATTEEVAAAGADLVPFSAPAAAAAEGPSAAERAAVDAGERARAKALSLMQKRRFDAAIKAFE